MGRRINIQPQALPSGSAGNLLNGALASLSGPTGFTATQPRILVNLITVVTADTSPHTFSVFKGASGASVSGTEVLQGTADPAKPATYEVDLVLEAADFLTGIGDASNKVVVTISAEIEF